MAWFHIILFISYSFDTHPQRMYVCCDVISSIVHCKVSACIIIYLSFFSTRIYGPRFFFCFWSFTFKLITHTQTVNKSIINCIGNAVKVWRANGFKQKCWFLLWFFRTKSRVFSSFQSILIEILTEWFSVSRFMWIEMKWC